MRSTLVALTIALCATICRAQEPYSHYLDSTCIWYGNQFGVDGINSYYTRLTFYIDGDTLLGGTPHFKQYYTRWDSTVHIMFPSPPTVTTSGPSFYRGLREDSLDRFLEWRNWQGADVVINDFRLAVADTFPDAHCAIDSISTLFFNGSPLKRFWPTWSILGGSAIEGVGNAGPICGMGIEGNAWLGCFSKQGLTLQVDTASDCSVWPAPVYHHQIAMGGVERTAPASIRLYPNPTNDRFSVEWTAGMVDELVLLNAQGAIEEQRRITNSDRAQFSMAARSAGVYLLQLKKAGRIVERWPIIKH